MIVAEKRRKAQIEQQGSRTDPREGAIGEIEPRPTGVLSQGIFDNPRLGQR
jgi:hypothetical protein